MRVTARYTFDAAHFLHDQSLSERGNADAFGPCTTMHGHTYTLEVTMEGSRLEHGMLINFSRIDAAVNERIVSVVDHGVINRVPWFADHPTTAEEIARWIWIELADALAGESATLSKVRLWEGPQYSATVTAEDFAG